jgi:hypothetical protein
MHDVLVWDVAIGKHDLTNALRPAKLLDAVLGDDGYPCRIVRTGQ